MFKQNGRVMELKGTESPHPTPIAQLQAVEMESQSDMDLNKLLAEFDSLFQEPEGLPPARSHDHHINLELGRNTSRSGATIPVPPCTKRKLKGSVEICWSVTSST